MIQFEVNWKPFGGHHIIPKSQFLEYWIDLVPVIKNLEPGSRLTLEITSRKAKPEPSKQSG